ncbi:MAG: PepSY domain-containing protein, partial [Alphaproteobacteria bacterium]|nr:PepSY domain-containing protein [Alphaproteobacteria bacterium]
MKTRFTLTLGAMLMSTTAYAEISQQSLIDLYANYQNVEIKYGPTQVKVEAVKDGVKYEVVYDSSTGKIIKQESEAADADDLDNDDG